MRTRNNPKSENASPLPVFAALTLLITGAITISLHSQLNWPWLITYLLGINAATIILYAWDKGSATRRGLRVPERLLHAAAFLGGTPAALLGQRFLRHKTLKRSFQITFWILVILQIAIVAAWFWWRSQSATTPA